MAIGVTSFPQLFSNEPAAASRGFGAPGPLRRRRAVLLAVTALLAAFVTFPADAARKKKTKKKAAPIPAVPRPHDPYQVSFTSSDGVRLVATWRPVPEGPAAPAVLLLHAFSRERRELTGLADELAARGFSTLALDLRGHGESTSKGGARVGLSPSLQGSPNGFPRDVEAACAWLRQRAPRIGVLGFSVSGNLAALATASGCAEAGVAVSTNADRFQSLAGARPRAPRALLVLAAKSDPGRADSARTLDAAGQEPKSVILYPGSAHGLELLRTEPAAKLAAFAWLEARIGPVVPSPAPVATVVPSEPESPSAEAAPAPAAGRNRS